MIGLNMKSFQTLECLILSLFRLNYEHKVGEDAHM